ncbi:MAG: hypothetical protein HC898_07780 [Phycisphaerales bacterium]|nr:hypothetical protein [Phycisphaerales bacterium]
MGVSAAKSLAWALDKPIIGVDHVQAHLYAGKLKQSGLPVRSASKGDEGSILDQSLVPLTSQFALGLVVSGGHTSMYEVKSPTQLHLLGRTIDDAVGEAYDKAAVILGVPYPGGPNLDRLAQQALNAPSHPDPKPVTLPRSLLGPGNLDFSFSGLKTALLYAVRGIPQGRGSQSTFTRNITDLTEAQRIALAAAFQEAAIDTLITKLNAGWHTSRTRTDPHRRSCLAEV